MKPKIETDCPIIKAALKLDGVACVNLAEPSPGDLERINNAYNKALNRIAELEAINAKLKACAEFYANKDNYSLVDEGRDYQSDYKCYELNETTYADEALGTKARTTLAEVAELEKKVKESK